MKRLILIMAIIFATVQIAEAQWRVTHIDADDLRGTKEEDVFTYIRDDSLVIINSNKPGFIVQTMEGFFDFKTDPYLGWVTRVLVGFYDEEGNMLEKKKIIFSVVDDEPELAYCRNKQAEKIIKHLKNKGTIRLIFNRYGKTDLDIMVPKNPEIKTVY